MFFPRILWDRQCAIDDNDKGSMIYFTMENFPQQIITISDVRSSSCIRGSCAGDAPTEQLPTVPNPQPYPNDQLPPIDPTFASPSCSEGFRVGDQFDCSRFWQCKPNGFYSNRGCREGYHFDLSTKECVQGSCTLNEACQEGAFQPLEICGQYKTCYGGRWITAQCMHNSRFFDGKCSQESCDDRHYDEGNVAARECLTGTVSPGSSNDRYLMCYYGRWTERHCPPGHVFDWKTLRCHTNVPEPEYRPDCYDGWTKSSGRCGHYEVCEYGKWIPKTCPYGQRFVNGYCIDGSCEETSGFCRESGGPDGYRAVRYDCTKYFQCVHGSWMERPCAPATAWNAALTTCDHIGNVPTCGGY